MRTLRIMRDTRAPESQPLKMQGTTGGENTDLSNPVSSRSSCEQWPYELQIETSVHIERHYAVTEIAEMWNLSADKVRELFEDEPGVLVIGERSPRHKRRYVTLRIPQTVVERVHCRLSSKSGVR